MMKSSRCGRWPWVAIGVAAVALVRPTAWAADRVSWIADGHDDEATVLQLQPRSFDVVALEPRYAVRIDRGRGPFHDLAVGLRGTYERGRLRGGRRSLPQAPAAASRARTSHGRNGVRVDAESASKVLGLRTPRDEQDRK